MMSEIDPRGCQDGYADSQQDSVDRSRANQSCPHIWICMEDGKHGKEEVWQCSLCKKWEYRK